MQGNDMQIPWRYNCHSSSQKIFEISYANLGMGTREGEKHFKHLE